MVWRKKAMIGARFTEPLDPDVALRALGDAARPVIVPEGQPMPYEAASPSPASLRQRPDAAMSQPTVRLATTRFDQI